MARLAAAAAAEKKAVDIVALDVSEALFITDVFLVCTGGNELQVAAIMDEVERVLHAQGFTAARREGDRERRWVLLDFIDIVVHVQLAQERMEYSLERLWKDCPAIDLRIPALGLPR